MTFKADSSLVHDLVPSPNVEPRRDGLSPTILLMHYTGLPTVEQSIDVLSRTDCKVSCHYVIGEDGRVTQMVPEHLRAWHAGEAIWAGQTDVNSMSIGIEIQNPGHDDGYPDFPEPQMIAVERLSLDILSRHDIPPHRVLGHSDVAPSRKRDPGEKFDWARLAGAGVGMWLEPDRPSTGGTALRCGDRGPAVAEATDLLSQFGYGIAAGDVFDDAVAIVVTAFQRHFRPALCDGVFDASCRNTLKRLLARSV